MPKTLANFGAEVAAFKAALDHAGLSKVAYAVAVKATKDADAAVVSALGDNSLSHWRRGNPIAIVAEAKAQQAPGAALVRPKSKAAGPWRVLQDGRNAYAAGDRRATGKLSKKTGMALTRKVKRATGSHGGRGTWSVAQASIRSNAAGYTRAELIAVRKRTMGR